MLSLGRTPGYQPQPVRRQHEFRPHPWERRKRFLKANCARAARSEVRSGTCARFLLPGAGESDLGHGPNWSAGSGRRMVRHPTSQSSQGAAGQHCEDDGSASAQLSVSRGRRHFRATSTRSPAGPTSTTHDPLEPLRRRDGGVVSGPARRRVRRRGHRLPSLRESEGSRP